MGMIINPYVFGAAYDTDAQAFFTAAGITDTTQKSAVNQLVLDLKSYGIWSKMKALYPMVGGTSTTHSYNLINTAQYQLTFNGGWTHSSTGALPNGTNAYADTGLNASTVLASFNSNHISFYSRTNNLTDSADMGGGSGGSYLTLEYTTNWNGNTYNVSYVRNPSTGFFKNIRENSTSQKIYKNGSQVGTTNTTSNTGAANANIFLGARNIGGGNQYAARECALASIGDGLSSTEAANFYTAVQAFQTTLSRNV